ncbi:glycosyltransferase family 4 protein [Sphingosinicella soli]|uniref:Glycosyltransferase involved in cell wall biosynthesis n=1 Tax=Sphingosinicella soli TaxID=333708 RepID=A0A7W7F6W0_9SPHN|nr:glycosyltransferase family 4 protein [Sphingosinicella soli]MBB4632119.1 glycosyltransferase involved in cell wall biosynthesis [Sphingosinicella soli]
MSVTLPPSRTRLLHLHSTFDLGGKEARAVRLMNALGDGFVHDIVSAVPEAVGAARQIAAHVDARVLRDFPPLAGRLTPAKLKAIGTAITRGHYDLVLTYNWGALDGVMANRLFAHRPLVHHEDGFNDDEAVRQKPARILYRRLALPSAAALVVPSQVLERIALGPWKQPRRRVVRVPNGIDSALFSEPPPAGSIPGFERREGEVVVGTLAGLRKVKNLPRLVRAFAAATRIVSVPARLVIVGEGPEREAILAAATEAGVADRLLMPGFLGRPETCVGHFDIFALSSDSEQFPLSLVEAMAAGLPAVATDVGDVRAIVSERNRPMIARADDDMTLGRLLARMIGDPLLRAELGAANRARAIAEYDEAVMVERYRDIYAGAMDTI